MNFGTAATAFECGIGKQVRKAGDMREDAVEIAIQCLTFISEDMDRLGKFLALSGVGPEKIRESAQDRKSVV